MGTLLLRAAPCQDEGKKESRSFLKKRTKKLLQIFRRGRGNIPCKRYKVFLRSFFCKKSDRFPASCAPPPRWRIATVTSEAIITAPNSPKQSAYPMITACPLIEAFVTAAVKRFLGGSRLPLSSPP